LTGSGYYLLGQFEFWKLSIKGLASVNAAPEGCCACAWRHLLNAGPSSSTRQPASINTTG
jgi:hypothetical protein